MSRSQNRGKRHIGRRPDTTPQKPKPGELKKYLMRAWKRALIARGLVMDPATRPEKWAYTWEYADKMGTVYADNRSDARGLIKKALGFSKKQRLPQEVRIVRAPNLEYTRAVGQSYENLRALSDENKASTVDR